MTWQFGQALNGNIAVMGEIDVAANREFTIAISFGDGNHAAIAQMMQTLATPYDEHQKRFLLQWTRSISPPRQSIVASVCRSHGWRQADAHQP